jgi:hypothetical protein
MTVQLFSFLAHYNYVHRFIICFNMFTVLALILHAVIIVYADCNGCMPETFLLHVYAD